MKFRRKKGSVSQKGRVVEQPKYKSFRLQKKKKSTKSDLPPSWRILLDSIRLFKENWPPLLGLAVIYQILVTIFVKNLTIGIGLQELQDQITETVDGVGQIATGAALFGSLVGSGAQAATEVGSIYQMILVVIFSLAFIWLLRQIMAGHEARVKEAIYKGMHPLIPFVLVLMVIFLQLIPMALATFVYAIVVNNGIAVNVVEHVVWALLTFSLSLLSLYMVSSSIFAIYVVTLPDTKPMQALRTARELVRHRRFAVLRKLLFLPFSLMIIGAGLMIPVIVWLPGIGLGGWIEWIFYGLTMVGFVVVHIYLYSFYRKLIV